MKPQTVVDLLDLERPWVDLQMLYSVLISLELDVNTSPEVRAFARFKMEQAIKQLKQDTRVLEKRLKQIKP